MGVMMDGGRRKMIGNNQTNRQRTRQRGQTDVCLDKQTLGSGIEGGSDEGSEKDSNGEVIGYNKRNRHKDTLTKRQKDTHTNRRRKKHINKMVEGREQICDNNLEFLP